MDDPVFLEQLRAGDEQAFRRLVEENQRLLYAVCLRMMGDSAEAEELTQEVFIRAFQAIDRFEERAKLSSWLCKIAVNLCYNRIQYLQRRGGKKKRSLDHFVGDRWERELNHAHPLSAKIQGPEEAQNSKEVMTLISRALLHLSEELRSLVILRDVEELSYQEIVEITGLQLGTVKSRLHRARGQVFRIYEALQRGDFK